MPNRPQTDPLSDSLADFSEAERDVAMSRFQALRPHVQDGATLTEARIEERRGKPGMIVSDNGTAQAASCGD